MPRRDQTPLWFGGLIVCAIVAAYANSLHGPFVFDDIASIVENPTLGTQWTLPGALAPPGRGVTVTGRPLLNLTFALNYAGGGLDPFGYHLVNLAIHACAALLLFGLMRRSLGRVSLEPELSAVATPVSAVVALLWALHPLQTESVTYVVQRAESLMSCFYLLTLYAFVRSLDARPTYSTRWQMLSAAACLAGMATKEVMVSAPLMVLLYDRTLGAGTWRALWTRRKIYHLALAFTWLVLFTLVLAAGNRGGTVGTAAATNAIAYWATQPAAILGYVKLAAWPQPLIFDYGTEWTKRFSDIAPSALMVGAGIVATLAGLRRMNLIGLLGFWFFALLAPTSLMPGARQTMAEHRVFLALAPLIILVVFGVARVVSRPAFFFLVIVEAGALGVMTFARNATYHSALMLWSDTVAKQPANPWARGNLGKALLDANRPADALAQFERAIQLRRADPASHFGAGNALMAMQRITDAIAAYREALRFDPNYLDARYNLGVALLHERSFNAAVDELFAAVRLAPNRAESHATLGNALARAQRPAEAETSLLTALRLRPDLPEASYTLGVVYLTQERWTDAATQFRATLRAQPDHAKAHASLGYALARLGDIESAVTEFHEAVRLDPNNAELHNNLGSLYRHSGRAVEATAEFEAAHRLAPDLETAKQGREALSNR